MKLSDFGMAKEVDKLHVSRSCKGSAYRLAPEVIDPKKTDNHAADIWSLGYTVLEMHPPSPPLGDLEWHRLLWKVGHGMVPPISEEFTSRSLETSLKCLRVNAADRPNCHMLLTDSFIIGTPIRGPVVLVMPLELSSIVVERSSPLGHSSIIDNTVSADEVTRILKQVLVCILWAREDHISYGSVDGLARVLISVLEFIGCLEEVLLLYL